MDELRWILLIVGLLILAGIYFFANPTGIPHGSDTDAPLEGAVDAIDDGESGEDGGPLDPEVPDEDMERELKRLGRLISEERKGVASGDAATEASSGADAGDHGPAVASDPERVVALYLKPPGDMRLSGARVLKAAEKVGLSYGDMQIFHRIQEVGEQHVAVFSLADMLSPGSFDLKAMDSSSTPGLCLFMTLPNPLSALDAWDTMLAAGQRLADILESDLLDEAHSSLSRQRIAHIREEMRDYDRRFEYSLPR